MSSLSYFKESNIVANTLKGKTLVSCSIPKKNNKNFRIFMNFRNVLII